MTKKGSKDTIFDARLWKIGGSVVFTLPSEMQTRFGGDFVQTTISVGKNIMTYLMMPWKCGGSFVITVPKQYVTAYGLSDIIKSKDKVRVELAEVRSTGGQSKGTLL